MSVKFTQYEAEQKFINNNWTLLDKYINRNNKVKARCPYCQHIILVIPNNIFHNKQKSCGCMVSQWSKQKQSLAPKNKSLGCLYPEMVKLYSKNNKKSVFEIYPKSNKKYLWICEKYKYKHEYCAISNSVVGNNTRCPYCANQRVLIGFNDLASQYPDLIEEWDYDKNVVKPTEVTCGSGKRIWWICKQCGYKWKNSIRHRVSRNQCCPKCCPVSYGAEEVKQWLKKHDINFDVEKEFDDCKNKQPLPFDFYLLDYNILIEYNGKQHYEPIEYFGGGNKFKRRQLHDQIKKQWAKNNNINLLIIPYWEKKNIQSILEDSLKSEVKK